jgi:sentrin-specific protease 8
VAFHYDSLGDANMREAQIATQKLATLCQTSLRFLNLNDTPRQDNGSDCGVHVCMTMKYLLVRKLLQKDATQKIAMSMHGVSIHAKRGRRDMIDLIESYRKEGRSRSRTPQGRKSSDNPPRIGTPPGER